MSRNAWLTFDDIPSGRVEKCISLPDDELWLAAFRGAFLLLTKEENWQEFGDLSPEEVSLEWLTCFVDFVEEACTVIPTGVEVAFAGDTIPNGWLLCNGQAVSRTTYANLYTLLSDTYGNGDGSTTFNLPDRRGRVGVGVSASDSEFNVLGEISGAKVITLSLSEIPAHDHEQDSHTHIQDSHTHIQSSHNHGQKDGVNAGGGNVSYGGNGLVNADSGATLTDGTVAVNAAQIPTNQYTKPIVEFSGGGGGHSNLQPSIARHYIIKT